MLLDKESILIFLLSKIELILLRLARIVIYLLMFNLVPMPSVKHVCLDRFNVVYDSPLDRAQTRALSAVA